MNIEEYWYWINNIPGIGRKTIGRLLNRFDTVCEIYNASDAEIGGVITKKELRNVFHASKCECKIQKGLQILHDKNVAFIHPDHCDYPTRLKQIPDSPYGLYLKGKMPDSNQKMIAIIGTRECTRYGLEMAHFFGRELVKRKIGVVSGLARGIDGVAHRGALEGNGYTIGVLGGGIDNVYPKENYELFVRMEQLGGIISESNVGIMPAAGLFPQRNRLIAGLCDGILVIEAMQKSGTFITVDQGLEQGKEIFAVPGRIMDGKSSGCNHLIKLGAHLVTEVQDILDILHIEENDSLNRGYNHPLDIVTEKNSLAPLEKIVYDCLRIEAKYLDDIINKVQVAPQEVSKALNKMALDGIIVETTRNYYAIKL
ncbi:MAG: DNA-processing protein DprA [Eubacteriales bacterium]|nr:DNA-processing protein DprA [Eubacteriales bacterium]